ncbi:sugar nucleotide-binding protein [bacterium]|nr:sugar nucleotide-binding protein [bacterium]
MIKKILILGSTGMLGKQLLQCFREKGANVKGAARKNADINFDIADDKQLIAAIYDFCPDVIINTAAIVNFDWCEKNKGMAYCVNSRPLSILVEAAKKIDSYLIQVSTDHYYTGDKNKKHSEKDNIVLVNEYARTKFAAEAFALTYNKSLVLRTNIIGYKGDELSPTFIEWAEKSLKEKMQMILFNDYYSSSISVLQFAKICYDLIELKVNGLLNLASRDVFSKKDLIEAFAEKKGYSLTNTKVGSVFDMQGVRRAESLGLDVKKIESLVGYKMPGLEEVIQCITQKSI